MPARPSRLARMIARTQPHELSPALKLSRTAPLRPRTLAKTGFSEERWRVMSLAGRNRHESGINAAVRIADAADIAWFATRWRTRDSERGLQRTRAGFRRLG